MGDLLPVRHPNRDFFIVDIADAAPKDDMATMEHPIFSLSSKPDSRHLEYTGGNGHRLRVIPSGLGLATVMDKDILLYCISKLVSEKNKGQDISPVVEVSAYEVMVATNWNTNGKSYKRFEDALLRLRGTSLVTDIRTGDTVQTKGFGLIDSFEVDRIDDKGELSPFGRLSKVRITLSDWTYRAIESMEVLSISFDYFRLRRPLERRLYEIARKHVGSKNKEWRISLEKLSLKVGTSAPLKKFRFNVKEIIRDGNIPDYGFMLDGDIVVMQRLVDIDALQSPDQFISLRPDTIDKAQVIAAKIGISVWQLEKEWNDWAGQKEERLINPDAAFLAFCQQKVGSQAANNVVVARKRVAEARQLSDSLPDLGRR